MISLVIPTMWKFEPFPRFLSDLVKLDVINEIIIIDNAPDARPAHRVLSHPKIKHYCFDRNIFVNPAWNFGVAISRNDVVCIMNDDIIVDIKVFHMADSFMDSTKFLVVDNSKNGDVNGVAKIVKHYDGLVSNHCGSLMFVHKSNWVDIPAGLDLCYGDNWIFSIMHLRGIEFHIVMDLFYHTPISVTSRHFVTSDSLTREGVIFTKLVENYEHINCPFDISKILDYSDQIQKIDLTKISKYATNATWLLAPVGETYKLLAFIAKKLRNKLIFDIGTAEGTSALALAYGESNTVISYDIAAQRNLRGSPANVEFAIGDFRNDLRILNSSLIFVDLGMHDGVQEAEIHKFLMESKYKGVVLWDDIDHFDGMRNWWNSVNDPSVIKLDITKIGHWSGTGMLVYT